MAGPQLWTSWTAYPHVVSDLELINDAIGDLHDRVLNVKDYGAVGNGSTDDSAAFTAAYLATSAAADSSTQTIGDGSRRGRAVIDIPPGVYKITSAAAMMSDLSVTITTGVVFRGAGREMTHIVFSPSTADAYLFEDFDWKHLTFQDLTFHSTVASASFMKASSATAAVSNFSFSRVNWRGTWKYGLHLIGADNLDSMSWYHCGIYASWTAFLFSDASTGSDQFVNYNFYACQVEYPAGNFVDMALGGNISFWGGSLIHNGSTAQIFFALRGATHSSGVARLLVMGARIEHRHLLSQLVYSEWPRGNISFISCDSSVYASLLANPQNLVQAEFSGTANELPSVVFDQCALMGKHTYKFDGNSSNFQRRIEYRSSTIRTFASAYDFITITNTDATGNVGGTPPIVFTQCRGSGGFQHPFDCVLNWQIAKHAQPREQRVSLKNSSGTLPVTGSAAVEVWLPLNAVITAVRFHKEADGSASSTTFTYPLATSEGTPTVIATGVGNGSTAWSAGFDYQLSGLWFVCNSDVRRHLLLTATNITQFSTTSTCVISYLA